MEKYYPNGVFMNPDYVEDMFEQLTQSDKDNLLKKLCNCYSNKRIVVGPDDWQDAIDDVSTKDIVDYIGEIELLDKIDNNIIAEYAQDHCLI